MFWLHVWYATPTDTITPLHSNVGHMTSLNMQKKLKNPIHYVMRRSFMTKQVDQKTVCPCLDCNWINNIVQEVCFA